MLLWEWEVFLSQQTEREGCCPSLQTLVKRNLLNVNQNDWSCVEIPEEDNQLLKRACSAHRVSFLCSNYKAVFIAANSASANYQADLTRASSRSPPRTSSETPEQLVEHLGERGCCCVLAVWMLAPAGTRLPPQPNPLQPNPGLPCFYPGSCWGQLEHLRLSQGRLSASLRGRFSVKHLGSFPWLLFFFFFF